MPSHSALSNALALIWRFMPFKGTLRQSLPLVSDHRVLDALDMFVPNSKGQQHDLVKLSLHSARHTFTRLENLLKVTHSHVFDHIDITTFCGAATEHSDKLRSLFDKYGSDKGSHHRYSDLYAKLLADSQPIARLLEIGLGSTNPNIASNMGTTGRPGASLCAFREFLPHAWIYGADFDKSILFQDDRITTVFVDQTNLASFSELRALAGEDGFDLIIDDGLHAPDANLAVLLFALDCLSSRGTLVIEDIPERSLPIWHVVRALTVAAFETTIIRAPHAYLVLLQKRPS